MDAHDRRDEDAIALQLGRTPRGDVTTATRCPAGAPQVIRTAPVLADGSPFPTLYWLTCPVLRGSVADLESRGKIAEIQKMVDADPQLSDELIAAARAYALERDGVQAEASLGIGGASEPCAVKCLHAHYAHYLATGTNPIGRIVAGTIECPDPATERICEDCRV